MPPSLTANLYFVLISHTGGDVGGGGTGVGGGGATGSVTGDGSMAGKIRLS
eukprot:m.123656 g.123656  ORF g.123656 m.123656 type:complete len:51 (+) comp16598_c0_seq1:82-234(+)